MLHEESPQMARTNSHPFGKLRYVPFTQSALENQPKGTVHYRGCTQPCRRTRSCLRLAPFARAKTCRLSSSGTRKQHNISWFGKGNRTDISAIDPRSRRPNEESPIEARIAAVDCLPADVWVDRGFMPEIPCTSSRRGASRSITSEWPHLCGSNRAHTQILGVYLQRRRKGYWQVSDMMHRCEATMAESCQQASSLCLDSK